MENNDTDQASSFHLRKIKYSEKTEKNCHCCCYADLSRNCPSEKAETKKDRLEEKEQISCENVIKSFSREKKWIFDKGGSIIEDDIRFKQKSDFPKKMELESKMEKGFSEKSKLEKEICCEWTSSFNHSTCEHQNLGNGKQKNFQSGENQKIKINQIEFEIQRNVDEINSLRNNISNEENNFHSDFPKKFQYNLECYSNVKVMDQVVDDDDDENSLKELQMSNENENYGECEESIKRDKNEECNVLLREDVVKAIAQKEGTKEFVCLFSEVTNEERDKFDKIEVVAENDVTHVTTRHHTSAIQPKKVSLPGHPNQVEEAHQSQILFIIVAIFLFCR